MKLIVGLGNPGREYAGNRHNVGFMAAERIATEHQFGPWKKKFQGFAADGTIAGEKVLLLKPETYMNESGRSVREAARFLKIDLADVIVLYDEIDLASGKLKIKVGGGNAGHNGLRSISAHLGNDYVRVRIGVGHPGQKELVARWVLSDFAKTEYEWLDPLLDGIAASTARLVSDDHSRFLTDVARLTGASPDPRKAGSSRDQAGIDTKPDEEDAVPNKKRSRTRHPTGERAAKREGALAENLKRFLAAQKGKE